METKKDTHTDERETRRLAEIVACDESLCAEHAYDFQDAEIARAWEDLVYLCGNTASAERAVLAAIAREEARRAQDYLRSYSRYYCSLGMA